MNLKVLYTKEAPWYTTTTPPPPPPLSKKKHFFILSSLNPSSKPPPSKKKLSHGLKKLHSLPNPITISSPNPREPSPIANPSAPSILHTINSKPLEELDDGALDSFISRLSPKEQTLVLKSQRDWRRMLLLFRRVRSHASYRPNPIHYNVVFRALGRARQWDDLRLCWLDMARDALLPTNTTYATLIDVFDKAGLSKESLLWLKHMKSRGIPPDEVTMNTALRVLKDSAQFDRAEKLFHGWCAGRVELEEVLDSDSVEMGDLNLTSPMRFLLAELLRSGSRAPVSRIAGGSSGWGEEEGPRKPRRAATYNTLIDLYGKAGRLVDASEAFGEMLRSGVTPDVITFNTMINICGSNGLLTESESLLAKMEERRIFPDTKTYNIFMTLYASSGNIEAMLNCYKKTREGGLLPDVVTHRIILQVLCKKRMVEEVEVVIDEMVNLGVRVDEQSLPVVIEMYIIEGLLDKASFFYERHCSSGDISSKNYAAIIDAYAEKGLWKEAEHVFFGKKDVGYKKDVAEYNVMIKAYGKAKLYDKALSLFENMRNHGNWPDECTYNSLIQMLSVGDLTDRAREILDKMKQAGFRPRCETFSAVIRSYSKAGMVSDAVGIYHDMKNSGVQPNEVVFGLLIDVFAESGNVEEAVQYFHLMEEFRLAPNQIVFTSLIKAYSKVGCWKEAQELYAEMKNLECGPDIIASNCMINLYAGLGMVGEAQMIFDELRRNGQADGVSYSTMMYLYKSMGMLDEAIGVAQEVQQLGLLTNCASYNYVLASYAANGKLASCGALVQEMLKRKVLPDASTFKTMFTVLKKAGLPHEAVLQLESSYIDGKPYARQIVITSLLSIVGLHAYALESCEHFVNAGIALDSSAYNVALRAYGASGDVERALNVFMRMQDQGLEPDLVTYINLAYCYGKAGMVEGIKRIYGLLKYGKLEFNESLFRALIYAYKDAGRDDLGELVDQEMRFSIYAENCSGSESESESEDTT